MSEFADFAYTVTPAPGLGEADFESALAQEVLPKPVFSRRTVRRLRQELVKLPAGNGHGNVHILLLAVEFVEDAGPGPEADELKEHLGSLGDAEPWRGPIASIVVNLETKSAVIQPNKVTVRGDERMIWSIHGVPKNRQPWIDFFDFQPRGAGILRENVLSPFAELVVKNTLISSGRINGSAGTYWYEVALVPGRHAASDEIVRLECESWPGMQPGDPLAAAIEVSDPPPRTP